MNHVNISANGGSGPAAAAAGNGRDVRHIFLVGAKSLGAYGGYETFINKLTEYHQDSSRLKYHIACKANGEGSMDVAETEGAVRTGRNTFSYHNADCFLIRIPEWLGPAQAVYYDLRALAECCRIIKKQKLSGAVVYVMACRVGPFMRYFYRRIHRLGGCVCLNPDGHEWLRTKWSAPVRSYWRFSEMLMVKWSDLVICDSASIESYIHSCYDGKGRGGASPRTTFIPYGAETKKSGMADDDSRLLAWYRRWDLRPREYYLAVGRFVPENNYETMIREFMRSHTPKDFAIITNANPRFLEELERRLHFRSDKRIKFVGTVYDQELLKKIRENAYGYFHGHEVGGTNPSLLEALGSTDLNLLLDVGFNREVAEDAALYWRKETGNLARLIDRTDQLDRGAARIMGEKSRDRINSAYSWNRVCGRYFDMFLNQKQRLQSGKTGEFYAGTDSKQKKFL